RLPPGDPGPLERRGPRSDSRLDPVLAVAQHRRTDRRPRRGAGRLPHRDLRRRLTPAPPGTQLVTVRDSTRWTGSSTPRSRPGRPQPPTPLRARRRAGLRLPGRTRLLRLTDPAHLA